MKSKAAPEPGPPSLAAKNADASRRLCQRAKKVVGWGQIRKQKSRLTRTRRFAPALLFRGRLGLRGGARLDQRIAAYLGGPAAGSWSFGQLRSSTADHAHLFLRSG